MTGSGARCGVTLWLTPEVPGNWFVLRDGLESDCRAAAQMGYDGVELMIRSAEDCDREELAQVLSDNGLELAAVSSGGGALSRGLSMCSPDPRVREQAREFAAEIIEFAGSFGAPVVFGMLRGGVEPGLDRATALGWLREAMNEAGLRARKHGQNILIEPQNRYEINLINRLDEGVQFIESLDVDNARILADLFHMNIEERSVCAALREAADYIGHVHLADSNRRAPGYGHMDFAEVARTLREIGFDGYVVAELQPYPSPHEAAKQAIQCFRKYFAWGESQAAKPRGGGARSGSAVPDPRASHSAGAGELTMRMAVGSDSTGNLTRAIVSHLEEKGIELLRCGTLAGKEVDYVDGARETAEAVASGQCEQGLIFCNTGTGAPIIANKGPGVRAALCVDSYSAEIARMANNANVLVLSIRLTGETLAKEIVDTWLKTEPSTEPRRMSFHRKTDELDRHYRRTE